MNGYRPVPQWIPALGCAGIVLAVSLMCLMPIVLVDVMNDAMQRLNLSPPAAFLAVLGILVGGLVNVPVFRIERTEVQPVEMMGAFGLWGFTPRFKRMRPNTIIAVNLGGCVIPTALAAWELLSLARAGGWPLTAVGFVAGINIAACYFAARPVTGIGIMMPGFVSPLSSVLATWVLLGGDAFADYRAPVAFIAGVSGPLIGADLLHLKDITRVSVGMLSIGGAGTFDGIILSAVLATVLV
ncbi:MAG TPA: DUF1614 domain-containing protein [Pirellulales bacterium]|nr:DUF1614 domain-containing protein [Pirellulales bacterium]